MQKEVIVTGTKYYKGIDAFDTDMNIVVEFDSENIYSNNAFKVLDEKGEQLGNIAENPHYIPRKITSEQTILSKELKQLVNDGYKIVNVTVKEIVRNYAILTVELEEEVILPKEAKESVYTVVGTRYHSTNANVGDIVRFKVVNNTTTLFNENDESLGVLPQSDEKIRELQSIEAPIVLNRFAKTDFNTMENVFVVSYIVEDRYIFLRELEEEDLYANEVVEETTDAEELKDGENKMDLKTKIKELEVKIEELEKQLKTDADEVVEETTDADEVVEATEVKEENGDDEMNVEILYGINYNGDAIKYDKIPFQENFDERIARFEQSDAQRDANKFTIVTYYSNRRSFGDNRTFETEINDETIKYLRSVIPHNQRKDEHIPELNKQLNNLIAQKGEFDPYWVDLYKHQTDYTTFQDNGKVYQIIGKGDKNIDYHHKVIRNVEIEYKGECPHNMHFWKANILE